MRVVHDCQVGRLKIVVQEVLFAGTEETIVPEGGGERRIHEGGGAGVDVFESEGEVGDPQSCGVV